MFSLKHPPHVTALAVNTKPSLNSVVYAVGNALGTGVVTRNGLYTSNTPEQQDGAWKWIRFSAAASPGNSGGPLLDANGKVIGVVVAKSPSENLNYALPIDEVINASTSKAMLDRRYSYQLDILGDAHYNGHFKARFALPKSLENFNKTYKTVFNANSDRAFKALLKQESVLPFPRNAGAARLLHSEVLLSTMPSLVARDGRGQWFVWQDCCRQFNLDGNGRVHLGALGRTVMIHLDVPHSVAIANVHRNAKLRMDLLLKTGMLHRPVATENIKITSLGQPLETALHTDEWGRHWHVDTWSLPYRDAYVIVYSLPVPDGSMMMMRFVPSGHRHDNRLDMDELTNLFYFEYTGTLSQWKKYLRETALLPAAFKSIHIDFAYGRHFSYRSRRLAFSFTPKVQAITPGNWMELAFSYFLDHGRVYWDAQDVRVWKNKASNDHNRINFNRFMAIPRDLDADMANKWQKVLKHRHPYDGVARDDDDVMKVDAVADPGNKSGGKPTVLYTAFYGVEGRHSQDFMKGKVELLMKHMQVSEH